MKIRQLSDLHLETGPFTYEDQGEDVVVLAGDIGVGTQGIEFAKTIPKPVVYVAGNHEHWNADIYENIKAMQAVAKGSNVHFLENDEVSITLNNETVRLLGCTLWTDFGKSHCENNPSSAGTTDEMQLTLMNIALRRMNDYSKIKAKKWWTNANEKRLKKKFNFVSNSFNPLIAFDMHTKSRAWLTSKLNEACTHKTVVVTHHAPSYKSLLEADMINENMLDQKNWIGYRNDLYNLNRVAAYASDLEDLLQLRADLWMHGHTHARIEYVRGLTRVSCNPRGYHTKPLTEKDAAGFAFWGYPLSPGAIERSAAIFAENPEAGDTVNFERNLVINL